MTKNKIMSKIIGLEDFLRLKKEKLQSKIIVFTNGCFDILHRGHVEYLSEAKSLGDILVVGLNSDSSVKRLKGESRPINRDIDRAIVLSSLDFVDFVIIFQEDTPYNLIKHIRPNILVKGGDWKVEEIVGADIVRKNGGKVFSLPYLKNYSTSQMIEKIIQRFNKVTKKKEME